MFIPKAARQWALGEHEAARSGVSAAAAVQAPDVARPGPAPADARPTAPPETAADSPHEHAQATFIRQLVSFCRMTRRLSLLLQYRCPWSLSPTSASSTGHPFETAGHTGLCAHQQTAGDAAAGSECGDRRVWRRQVGAGAGAERGARRTCTRGLCAPTCRICCGGGRAAAVVLSAGAAQMLVTAVPQASCSGQ